jgi:hypothetical protein
MIYRLSALPAMCDAQEHRLWAIILYSLLDGGNIRTFHCTLLKGHPGDHMSMGREEYPICHQWPQADTKVAQPPHVMPYEWGHSLEAPIRKTRIAGLFPYYRVFVGEEDHLGPNR